MSRFDFDYDDGEGLPYQLWESNVSKALGAERGQQALADMEAALLALPEPKLVEGHLAIDGGVCAIGALVAHKKSKEQGVDIATVIEAMSMEVRCWCGHAKDAHHGACSGHRKQWGPDGSHEVPCDCDSYEPDDDEGGALPTADAGVAVGLKFTVAWHLAYLNDEKFRAASPESRYQQMLAWVRRAQGREVLADG